MGGSTVVIDIFALQNRFFPNRLFKHIGTRTCNLPNSSDRFSNRTWGLRPWNALPRTHCTVYVAAAHTQHNIMCVASDVCSHQAGLLTTGRRARPHGAVPTADKQVGSANQHINRSVRKRFFLTRNDIIISLKTRLSRERIYHGWKQYGSPRVSPAQPRGT